MKGIILAGGLAKRFRPLSFSGPKQLVPIANKPVLHYIIEYFRDAGIDELGIVVGYTEERISAIKNSCGDGSKWGVRITYIEQDAPRGIAHAIYICKEYIGSDKFVVFLGDNLLKQGIKSEVKEFSDSKLDGLLLVTEVDNPQLYGVVELDKNNKILSIEEKPETPRSNKVIVGVYLFTPAIFPIIETIKPSGRGELEVTSVIENLINDPDKRVHAKQLDGWWDDTGTFEEVLNVNNIVLMDFKGYNKGTIGNNVKMVGEIGIGKNTVIKDDCVIRGPIIIGDNCTIGPHAYIGPYTSIGDNVTIVGGEIEASMILNSCYIHYKNRIIDSIIGENSTIIHDPHVQPKGIRFVVGDYSRIVKSE